MYQVTMINDGKETVIHSAYVNDLKLSSGQIKQQINKIPSFSIEFHPNNPAYGKMKPFKTLINVLDTNANKYVFEGRVLAPSDDMASDGLFSTSYDCEGELAYLHDSQQQHLEFQGSPTELLTQILNYHNAQVEDYKQFEVGNITVTDPNNYMYLYLSAEQDTYDTIMDELVDRLGGELQIRKENGVRYLDYLQQIGTESDTEIRIAKNLQSITVDRDPTEIVTRLTPLGTKIDTEGAIDASQARLTIESVNNGLPYIDRQDLINEFGIQGGSQTWDDITQASNLLSTGEDWLSSQKVSYSQYTINAVDLSKLGIDAQGYQIGNTHPVYNPVMGIDERLRIIGKTVNINNPESDQLIIGDQFRTLNDYQAEANKSARKVVALENTVDRQSQTIGTLQQDLNTINQEVTNVQQAINDADLPALEDAIDNLNQAVNNLTDTVSDIGLATQSEDGLMSSEDKTKLDGLETYTNATETTAGLMSTTDKAKLNLITVLNSVDLDALRDTLALITVTQSIDLDQLEQRVSNLEGS